MVALTKAFTASVQKSRVASSLKHNQRSLADREELANYGDHIDWNKTSENVTLVSSKSLRSSVNEVFKPYVDDYNAHQKRKDRKINDYYSKCLTNRNLTPTQEFVIQFGDKHTIFSTDAVQNHDKFKELYSQYLQGFKDRNKNLRVASAVIHFDEQGGPHMHMITIPVGHYSRGMKARANFDRAMGWNQHRSEFDDFRQFSRWKAQAFADWADNERDELIRTAQSMGYAIERKKQAVPHTHLEPQEYRDLQAKLDTIKQNVSTENENLSAIQKDKEALSFEVSQLKTKKDGYTKDIRSLQNEAETEKQNVYTLKQQKDEASENLRQLQALVKQLQKQKHYAQEAVNQAYADRKAKYLETSTAWGEYRDQMRQLKEDRWNLWNDSASCDLFKQRCRELRETNRALRAWRGGGFIAHTVHFILKLKKLSKERQLQELKDEQARAMQELQQRAEALAQQRKDLLQKSKEANEAIASAKELRSKAATELKEAKNTLTSATKQLGESKFYGQYAQQVVNKIRSGELKPSDALTNLKTKKPQELVDENKITKKQEQININLDMLDDDGQQL